MEVEEEVEEVEVEEKIIARYQLSFAVQPRMQSKGCRRRKRRRRKRRRSIRYQLSFAVPPQTTLRSP